MRSVLRLSFFHVSPHSSSRADCRAGAAAFRMIQASPTQLQSIQALGFPTPQAMSEALSEYINAHNWAFMALTKAYVIESGGVEWSQNPQQVFFFEVLPVRMWSKFPERNPSRAFRVLRVLHAPLEDRIAADHDPANAELIRRNAAQLCGTVRARCAGHPRQLAGVIQVWFEIAGCRHNIFGHQVAYPLFHPVRSVVDEAPSLWPGATPRQLVRWMIRLCRASVDRGFPLRCIPGNSPTVALPGRFVRAHGNWTWKEFFSDWDSGYRRGQHKPLDAAMKSWHPAAAARPYALVNWFNAL